MDAEDSEDDPSEAESEYESDGGESDGEEGDEGDASEMDENEGDEAPPRSRRPVEVIRVARVRDAVRRLAIHRCAPEGDVGEVAGSRRLAGPRQRPVGGVRAAALAAALPARVGLPWCDRAGGGCGWRRGGADGRRQ